jgi:hypothetical protein
MALLRNFGQARIPIEKLENYALNPDHPVGRNKAKMFRDFLGIERRHAGALAELIRSTLPRSHATQRETNDFGEVWTSYHEIVGLNGMSAIVTVAWMFKKDSNQSPELISCYIESREQDKLRKTLGIE